MPPQILSKIPGEMTFKMERKKTTKTLHKKTGAGKFNLINTTACCGEISKNPVQQLNQQICPCNINDF
jgi:hypothetical protein